MTHRLCQSVAAFVLSLLAVPALAASSLTLNSAAGDLIGQGAKVAWTAPTASFYIANASRERVAIGAEKDGQFFALEFAAPNGTTLARGSYLNSELMWRQTGRAPGLSIFSGDHNCDDAWGSFTIRQLEFDDGGQLKKFEATFIQRCNAANAPVLSGTLAYNTGPQSMVTSSPVGEQVGGGVNRSFYGHTSDLALHGTPNGLSYGASGLRDTLYLAISPPVGRTLAPGTYAISRAPAANEAGIFLAGDTVSCNTVGGTLVIKALSFDAENHASGLNATLTAYCNGSPVAFKATIRHNL